MMNDPADFVFKVLLGIATIITAAAVAIFAYHNLRQAEWRNRRLKVLEDAFAELQTWEREWLQLYAIAITKFPARHESEHSVICNEAIAEFRDAPNLWAIQGRLTFFGFEGAAEEIYALSQAYTQLFDVWDASEPIPPVIAQPMEKTVRDAFYAVCKTLRHQHHLLEKHGLKETVSEWIAQR